LPHGHGGGMLFRPQRHLAQGQSLRPPPQVRRRDEDERDRARSRGAHNAGGRAMKPRRYGPFPYSPIIDRRKSKCPTVAPIAVWIIPNIEFLALDEQVPAVAGGGGKTPDVAVWSSRDYGNRVGVFRLMKVMSRYGARGTVALNSELCAEHPRIIEE